MQAHNVTGEPSPVTTPKKKSRLKTFFKVLIYAFLILFFSALAVYLIYLSSGSSEWELEIDRDGVQVYSLKAPGSSAKKYRAMAHYENTPLTRVIALITYGDTLENCRVWIPTCTALETIKAWDPDELRSINLWRFDMAPFNPRELVVLSRVEQDPETLEVFIDVLAAPSRAELNDCCIRMTHMHNTWRYTPQPDGGVDVVYTQNISFGGLFPNWLLNLQGADLTYQLLHDKIPELLKAPDIQNITIDRIRELGE